MKVGTDAIILGIWSNVEEAKSILDVGTGSGIIALLTACRSKASIDAIELDSASAKEAQINFNNFNSNKVNLIHDDFVHYAEITDKKYDVIISNPPFFNDGMLPTSNLRKAARHTIHLTHEKLCKASACLLTEKGSFNVVVPADIVDEFVNIALTYKLNLCRQLIIRPKPNKKPNRINMEFRLRKSSKITTNSITIRQENNHYTDQYKFLVRNFLFID